MKMLPCISCLAVTALLAGCGIQRQPAPAKAFFLLNAEPDVAPAETASYACLHLRTVAVQPQLAGNALLYRTGQVAYEKDLFNQFLIAPDQQLGDILSQWLRTAGFMACLDDLDDSRQRLILEPHLEALYADFRAPAEPVAYVRIRFVITRFDRACRCSRIILDQTFDAAEPLPPRPAAQDVVEAMSVAVQKVMLRFFDEL